ncbi:MAG TPA: TauD/TfdA family dioxygenase, partial [Candidatus Hydrogenedentes bacterium]|nr:TauD/TfdA family dioxygenase [Candidatus Hydrogenedentota bacterium]
RYSYFTMAPQRLSFELMGPWYEAYRQFAGLLNSPANQYRFTLRAGDYVFYNNHRMVHAREAFSGPRWVRGIYFDTAQEAGSPELAQK